MKNLNKILNGYSWHHTIKTVFCLLTIVLLLASCEEDEIMDNRPPLIQIDDIAQGDTLLLNWSEEGTHFDFIISDNVGISSYTTNIDSSGINVFSFFSKDITNLLQHETIVLEGMVPDFDYDIKLEVEDINRNITSLDFLIHLTEEQIPLTGDLYGTGSAFGWLSTSLTQDDSNPNVFTHQLSLHYNNENKLFKFTLEEGEWNEIRYLVPETVDGASVKIVTEGEYDMYLSSEPAGNLLDHFWGIPEGEDGTYKLTVDTANLKLKVEKLTSEEPDETEEPDEATESEVPEDGTYENIYGTGIAFDWESTMLTQDPNDVGAYTYETEINYNEENKQFKFTLEEGNWNEIRYLVPLNVDGNGSVKVVTEGEYDMFLNSEEEGNLRDHFWGIPEGKDGDYRITVKPATLKLKVEKLTSDIPEEGSFSNVYGTGIAFDWESTILTQDSNDSDIYTIEAYIEYNEENKQFKFTLEEGNWNEIRYLVPIDVDGDGSVKVVTEGEYDMFLNSETEGNLRDHFWGIPEGEDGTYKLTVNPTLLKLKVEKLNP